MDGRWLQPPVYDLDEVINDAGMHERGMLHWVEHPEVGRVCLPSSPLPKRVHGYPLSRITLALSRCQSRAAIAARLSCFFFPSANPSSTFARPRSLK